MVIIAADVPCDDVFTFTDLVLTDSFMKDNIEYTLEIVGFIQNAQPNTTLTPIKVSYIPE